MCKLNCNILMVCLAIRNSCSGMSSGQFALFFQRSQHERSQHWQAILKFARARNRLSENCQDQHGKSSKQRKSSYAKTVNVRKQCSHESCIRSISLDCCCIDICCCCEVALVAEVAMAPERTLSAALILRESMSLKALTLFMSLREADYEQSKPQ